MIRRALGLAFVLCAAALAQDTHVILLGTGTPNPEPSRMGPAVAIVSADRVYLVDCGTGVVRRAVEAGLKPEQLTRAFITHLHSDHTLGYPDLMFTASDRPEPLEVYGPPGLRAMTAHIEKAWAEDRDIRLHAQPPSPYQFTVNAHEVKPGTIYQDATLRVIAFAVNHGTWKHAYGYRFEAKDKTIVLSGDTAPCESLIAAAQGCDILLHEVYSRKGWEKRTPDWRRYHAAFHTSAVDLGKIAARVNPKKLVLYHQLPMGETPQEVVSEVHEHFSGEVIYGNDLDIIR